MEDTNVAAVIGVGPGLGAAIARRFARGGYAVALIARQLEALEGVKQSITDQGGKAAVIPADAGDPASVTAAFAEVRERLGEPEVLVYNAGSFRPGSLQDITPEQLETSWRIGCLGAWAASREVVPAMLKRGRGTLLFTGATAALRGSANFAALAVGKFGLRALGQSLARELHPKGIHVAHIIIDGQIDSPRARSMSPSRATPTFLDPDSIAESYWQIHSQPPNAWTHELELRPSVEKF
jgi:NAD(P)-dependent dehydrogenase (short-subunit alcohol dehydrogenase family)